MATQSDPNSNSSDSSNSTTLQSSRAQDYLTFKRYAAWTFVVAAPILIALPPRKLDLYTVALSGAFVGSANALYRENNPRGLGILDDIQKQIFAPKQRSDAPSAAGSSGMFNGLPTERAMEVQARLRAAREASLSGDELEKYRAARHAQDRSMGEKIWLGGETEGWKERRLREEQKALEEGKGYGDLIMDHIWEVWNWGQRRPSSASESEKKDVDGK
jgi:hypothetical protein